MNFKLLFAFILPFVSLGQSSDVMINSIPERKSRGVRLDAGMYYTPSITSHLNPTFLHDHSSDVRNVRPNYGFNSGLVFQTTFAKGVQLAGRLSYQKIGINYEYTRSQYPFSSVDDEIDVYEIQSVNFVGAWLELGYSFNLGDRLRINPRLGGGMTCPVMLKWKSKTQSYDHWTEVETSRLVVTEPTGWLGGYLSATAQVELAYDLTNVLSCSVAPTFQFGQSNYSKLYSGAFYYSVGIETGIYLRVN